MHSSMYSCLFGWLCWHTAWNMVLCSSLIAFCDLFSALDICVFSCSVLLSLTLSCFLGFLLLFYGGVGSLVCLHLGFSSLLPVSG